MTSKTMPSTFEQSIETVIRDKRMCPSESRVLVAVSGGPDSVALLAVLHALRKRLGVELMVAHLDHGLRGEESKQDAQFVRQLCDRLGVEVMVQELGLKKTLARQQGLSLQEYAREARYTALYEMAQERNASKIALGHTADDQAETVLMWMIRGSGTNGLKGMYPVRGPYIIRPLLGMDRAEIVEYLNSRGLAYRNDSTNAQPIYLRNQIRRDLVPVLKRFNPKVVRVLGRQVEILREENRYLDQMAMDALNRVTQGCEEHGLVLSRSRLVALPLALKRRVICLAIKENSQKVRMVGFESVEAVLTKVVGGRTGAGIQVHGTWISREYETIRFQHIIPQAEKGELGDEEAKDRPIPIPSCVSWPLTGQTLKVVLRNKTDWDGVRASSPHVAYLDASTFTPSLSLRCWRPGDSFSPLGLGGQRKKLQDFFTDLKVERSKRIRLPLLVAPEGILWVAGYRINHRFRVTEPTSQVLVATMCQGC